MPCNGARVNVGRRVKSRAGQLQVVPTRREKDLLQLFSQKALAAGYTKAAGQPHARSTSKRATAPKGHCAEKLSCVRVLVVFERTKSRVESNCSPRPRLAARHPERVTSLTWRRCLCSPTPRKRPHTTCPDVVFGASFDSLQAAEDACTSRDDCTGVLDRGCDGAGAFELCRPSLRPESAGPSCLYRAHLPAFF